MSQEQIDNEIDTFIMVAALVAIIAIVKAFVVSL